MIWHNKNIMIIDSKPTKDELSKLYIKSGEFIKVVADIEQGTLAAGGELHADEEKILLESGSKQKDLWGANYYPKTNEIEYKSLINIRPGDNSFSQIIEDPELKEKIKKIVFRLLAP